MSTNPEETAGVDEAAHSRLSLGAFSATLSRFLNWWFSELRGMVPAPLVDSFAEPRLEVLVSPDGLYALDRTDPEDALEPYEDFRARTDAYDPTTLFKRGHGRWSGSELVLASSMVLVRDLRLPLETAPRLRRFLSFSMDRYTPFDADDVFFAYKVLESDRDAGKLVVRLFVAPRSRVEPVVEYLERDRLTPAVIDVEVAGEAGETVARAGLNLMEPDRRHAWGRLGLVNRLLAFSAVLLAGVAISLPLLQRHDIATALEAELAQTRETVREAESISGQLRRRLELISTIEQQQRRTPAMLDVFTELTRLLPDDAWASEVAIKSRRVRLSGEAASASAVMARLSRSPLFAEPRFEAPLTQNPKTGGERFVISLALRREHHVD